MTEVATHHGDGSPVTVQSFTRQIAELDNIDDVTDLDEMLAASQIRMQRIRDVVTEAADSLIDVHQRTGIDLEQWGPVLDLVRLVYPDFTPTPEEEREFTEDTHAALFGPDKPSLFHTPVGRATFTGAAAFPISPLFGGPGHDVPEVGE